MNTPKTKAREKEAYKIIRKIIRALKDPDVDLPEFVLSKKLKHIVGWCDYSKIGLGVFYDIIPTIIHEMIHYTHEDWSETKVTSAESLVKRYIKMKDVIIILKLFLEIISIDVLTSPKS